MSPIHVILQVLSVIALVSGGVTAKTGYRFPECSDPTANWVYRRVKVSYISLSSFFSTSTELLWKLAAAKLEGQCIGDTFSISPLRPGSVYGDPRALSASTPYMCSSVSYSMVSACAICQGGEFQTWKKWVTNCSTSDISVTKYPVRLPASIEVPAWAYINVEEIGTFDVIRAKVIAFPSRPRYSDLVLIGAVVGGALVLSVLAALFFYRRRKLHKKNHLASDDIPETEPLLASDGN
ncbi:hypothetical protein M422DRAFT_249890 [Sphaerobolus stellatus SS14]|uniref:Uncharacterized protein n=1 Tax=Sphaerobolus stellatus (strain SS14) TaxID=990650 RepID=A0A0C9W4W9_SPHS4|nr:hypothetical protein M422DRAFT_249890 [Sphaerobolus stellatus SS14]